MEALFNDNGQFIGCKGVPEYQDLIVNKLAVKDAVAYRLEKRYDNAGKYYNVYLKQPKVRLTYGKKNLYIIERKVVWDLIRNFDPQLDYTTFLEMLDYFSLYKILEDYIREYSDMTLGIWVGKANKHAVIMAVQRTETIQNLLHEEVIGYTKKRLTIDSTESFFKIGRGSNYNAAIPKRCRDVYLRIIKGDKILEIKEQIGKSVQHRNKHRTTIRLYLETFYGMVQMTPAKYFRKNLEFIESDKLYEVIDSCLKLMDEDWYQTKDYSHKNKSSVTETQYDELQYLWFVNSFSNKK